MSIQPLKERERFVVRGLVYKVIRARSNGKFTVRLKGVYDPPRHPQFEGKPPFPPKPLTKEEKKEEQDFFKEKEEPKDGKKDDSRTRERPVSDQEGSGIPATGS